MQFNEINIYQIKNFIFYTVNNKHEIIKFGNQTRENRKYYRKCSNDFADDCNFDHYCGATKHLLQKIRKHNSS